MDLSDFIIGTIFFLVVLAVIGGIGLVFMWGCGAPNSGTHTGFITAVEKDGIFQVNSAYIKTDPQSSQEDKYCVRADLVDTLRKLSESRQQVTVQYARGWTMPLWNCSTSTESEIIGIVK